VRAGLATAQPERVVAGGSGRTIEVARVRITEAGRRALVGEGSRERSR
jgi:hypothetical protein